MASLHSDGYDFLQGVLSTGDCQHWAHLLQERFRQAPNGPLRTMQSATGETLTYGARNVLSLVPEVIALVRLDLVREVCMKILGEDCGIVRALYFDKPPGASWSLSWHQDLTIAVKEHVKSMTGSTNLEAHSSHASPRRGNSLSESLQDGFQKPTTKAGVCHVEAPCWVLERMLTLRVHLDPMTETNGALYVRPGSHLLGKLLHADLEGVEGNGEPVYCGTGDIMLMRPLLSHASIGCEPGNELHRRIIHLELAASRDLVSPYEWHTFVPIQTMPA
jgi:hypothetical protein